MSSKIIFFILKKVHVGKKNIRAMKKINALEDE